MFGPPTPSVYVAPPAVIFAPVWNGGFRKWLFPASAIAYALLQLSSDTLGCRPFSAATITVTGYRPLTFQSFCGQLVFFAAIGGNDTAAAAALTKNAAATTAIKTARTALP